MHDARVLANSAIYRKYSDQELLQGEEVCFNGCKVPIFLVGDSAYPLLSWLIKPFATSPSLTSEQKVFNYRISRGRVVVEIAFGRLKARWRRLIKQNDMVVSSVPNVVAACCVLHNVCEIHGNTFNDEWLEDIENEDSTDGAQQPTAATTCSEDGKEIRDALMHYFVQNPLLV